MSVKVISTAVEAKPIGNLLLVLVFNRTHTHKVLLLCPTFPFFLAELSGIRCAFDVRDTLNAVIVVISGSEV